MTTRTDEVDVDFFASPRVFEVQAPATQFIMQDVVDTARKLEDSFSGMAFEKLINASGKEDLGGGVKVGITVAMQNMLLAFAGRTTPAQTGTVTSNPGSPVAGRDSFIDTAATFVTNSVARGSLVINFTDQSIAEVISVDSETQLTTKTLVNGIGNTYDVADVYHVFNIVQVSASGGNLVAVDDVGGTISPILPTAFTQVVLTSSSSATLQEQKEIQYGAFNNGITIDQNNVTGNAVANTTVYPAGTPLQPVTQEFYAHTLSVERGFRIWHIEGDLTLSAGTHPHVFQGHGMAHTVVTCAGADMHDAEFIDLMLLGTLNGGAILERVHVQNVTSILGVARNCMLQGTLILGGSQDGAHGPIFNLVDCMSARVDGGAPIIDFNGTGYGLSARKYSGKIKLINKTGPEGVVIDLESGEVEIDSTVTAGTITVRGVGSVIDNSTGTTTVVNEVVSGAEIVLLRKLMMNRMETNPTTGQMTIYDDDDTTVLLQGNIYEDVLATQLYRGRGMERRDKLA